MTAGKVTQSISVFPAMTSFTASGAPWNGMWTMSMFSEIFINSPVR